MTSLEMLSERGNRLVEAFINTQTRDPKRFNATISPKDEMYLFIKRLRADDPDASYLEYLSTGKRMLDDVRQIIDQLFGGFDKIGSFLDFACGYGRFTRFLVQEMPPERIAVSDIFAEAVEFQQSQFGVSGIVSVPDPKDFPIDRRYDCVVVASLFSHLPERLFVSWLARLYALLKDDGVLIFSVHGEDRLPPRTEMPSRGITHTPGSKSSSLDPGIYGVTYVTELFAKRALEEACGANASYRRIPRGLWEIQDLYVVPKHSRRDVKSLNFAQYPRGNHGFCIPWKDQLCLGGWAVDLNPGASIERLEVWVGARRVQICLPTQKRPDIAAYLDDERALRSGWMCLVPSEIAAPSEIVTVKVVSSTGLERVLSMDVLESRIAPQRPA